MINGHAVGGGCELTLACDIRICSDHARFLLPEIDLDAFPGARGTWLLPRIIGKSKAMLMVLTGEWIEAKEALEMGLVNKVVPYDHLMEEAKILASKRKLPRETYPRPQGGALRPHGNPATFLKA